MLELPASFKNIKDQAGHWVFKTSQIIAKKRVRILAFMFLTTLTAWMLNSRFRVVEERGNSVLPGVLDNPPQLAAEKLNGIIAGGIYRTKSTIPKFDRFGSLFLIPEPDTNGTGQGLERP